MLLQVDRLVLINSENRLNKLISRLRILSASDQSFIIINSLFAENQNLLFVPLLALPFKKK